MKTWHLIVIGIIILIGVIAAIEMGFDPTLIAVVVIIFIVFFVFLLYYFGIVSLKDIKKGKRSITEISREGIDMDEAKYAAAVHLLKNHGIDIFSFGTTPTTAQYTEHMQAERVFPRPDEEVWCVRLKIYNKKYFNGHETRIIIFVDGGGNVRVEKIMNLNTYLDSTLWRNPELYFIRGIPKTSKPRRISDIIARKIEETGEFPEGFTPSQIRTIEEEEKS